ncbi:MAG: YciI family protein [Novosphingobium sp.]
MKTVLAAALAAASCLALAPAAAAPKKAAAPVRQAEPEQPPAPVAKGRLYAVVLGPGPAWKKGQPFKGPGLEEHRRYWKKLHAEGRVASAGPLGADTGLAVVRARSQGEADALVAADPAVKARILRGVARPYASELVSTAVLTGR